jgi:hypothetical protein
MTEMLKAGSVRMWVRHDTLERGNALRAQSKKNGQEYTWNDIIAAGIDSLWLDTFKSEIYEAK